MPHTNERKTKRRANFQRELNPLLERLKKPGVHKGHLPLVVLLDALFRRIAASDVSTVPFAQQVDAAVAKGNYDREERDVLRALIAEIIAPHLVRMMPSEARQRRKEHPKEIRRWRKLA